MHSLPMFLRLQGRPVILLGKGEAAESKRRLLERAGAVIGGEDTEAQLAIVAVEDEGQALAAISRLKQRGIWVNATDRPALCDFTMPAIVDRDPVIVAIATGGASAGLAKILRVAIEGILPERLGTLAKGLADARDRIRQRWPDPAARRHAIDAALAPNGPLDPLCEIANGAVENWLSGKTPEESLQSASITINSADPDDLTLRQARLLGRADRIYHGIDVPAAILARARADAVRIACDTPPREMGDGLNLWLRWSR
jgi:uroporphyrin-III C-methyltransferase/precorrin-2 dehydrogenase/sirohydrochlorin ferrochelatase